MSRTAPTKRVFVVIDHRLDSQDVSDLAELARSRSLVALDGDAALEAVLRYARSFTGAHFETMGRPLGPSGPLDPEPNRFTSADAVSPALLSAPLRPSQIRDLHEANAELESHLSSIGADQAIADADDFDRDAPSAKWPAAVAAYNRLRLIDGIGRTRATKLLHRKRPQLIPVW